MENEVQTMIEEKMEIKCYSKIEAGLEELKKKHFGVVVDVTTKEGMVMAIKGRAELRDVRLNLEDTRKKEKKFYIEFGKKIDTKAEEILEIIQPMERYYDLEIKKEDMRKEDIRQAKIKAEQEEIAAKVREEERVKKEEADKAQAEKDRIALEEKKKFEEEQAKFRAEKEKFEKEQKEIQDKKDQEERDRLAKIKETQDKIDAENRASQLKREEEERASKNNVS